MFTAVGLILTAYVPYLRLQYKIFALKKVSFKLVLKCLEYCGIYVNNNNRTKLHRKTLS